MRHSEYNREDETTTLFQIWILTDRPGAEPGWGAMRFPRDVRAGRFVTLASGFDGDADALRINAAARVMGATLAAGASAELSLDPARHIYLVASKGPIDVNGVAAEARDGVAITGEERLTVRAVGDAELVLVDAK